MEDAIVLQIIHGKDTVNALEPFWVHYASHVITNALNAMNQFAKYVIQITYFRMEYAIPVDASIAYKIVMINVLLNIIYTIKNAIQDVLKEPIKMLINALNV